jgi:hypothetical protein
MLGKTMKHHTKLFLQTAAVAVAALIPALTGTAYAAAATLYLTPSTSSVAKGDSVTISVRENSGSESVNAVQANFSYPASLLQYVSTSNSSAFSIVAQTSAGSGSVKLARGALPAVSGTQVVASVTFKALASSGTAALTFTKGSSVVSATSNTNIMTNAAGTSVTLKASAGSDSSKQTADTTPPRIIGVAVSGLTVSSATITWSTSEPASSEVDYGLTTAYSLSASSNTYVTAHSVGLHTSLIVPGTTYYFRVKSTDRAGNSAVSSTYSFTTKGSTLVVTILDQKNNRPIQGAVVSRNGQSATTDRTGQASLINLPYGKLTVRVSFRGSVTNETVRLVQQPGNVSQKVSFTIATPAAGLPWLAITVLLALVLAAAIVGFGLRKSGKKPWDTLPPTNEVTGSPDDTSSVPRNDSGDPK